jgi:hypothetical protein
MISFKLEVTGLQRVQRQLARLNSTAIKTAMADALNDSAFEVRKAMQADFRRTFDRVSPYIVNAVRVGKATPTRLVATVEPKYPGGKGVDPQKVLAASLAGGRRHDKRSEVALRRAGLLPAGFQTVVPTEPYPGSSDGRGGIKGAFVLKLLSYFQAMGEQGYRSNMLAKTKDKMAKRGRSAGGYKSIGGVVFFATMGHLRTDAGSHLAPGIWAKSGTHGSNIRPVLLFTRAGTFARRLDMQRIVAAANPQSKFEKRMRFRIRQAVGE